LLNVFAKNSLGRLKPWGRRRISGAAQVPNSEQNRTDFFHKLRNKMHITDARSPIWPKIGPIERLLFGPQVAEYEGTPPGQFVIQKKSIPMIREKAV
jgi:hypothetical protein